MWCCGCVCSVGVCRCVCCGGASGINVAVELQVCMWVVLNQTTSFVSSLTLQNFWFDVLFLDLKHSVRLRSYPFSPSRESSDAEPPVVVETAPIGHVI